MLRYSSITMHIEEEEFYMLWPANKADDLFDLTDMSSAKFVIRNLLQGTCLIPVQESCKSWAVVDVSADSTD